MNKNELESMFDSIVEHYNHACEKHPFFADTICAKNDNGTWGIMANHRKMDTHLRCKMNEEVTAHEVFVAEMYEIFDAFCKGDYALARYEVLDAIAVLLRMDDMIRDAQERRGDAK